MEFSVMYPEMDKFRGIWNLGENCVLLRVVGVEEKPQTTTCSNLIFYTVPSCNSAVPEDSSK